MLDPCGPTSVPRSTTPTGGSPPSAIAIFELRADGGPGPWTDDPILQRYKFCNTFRASDRVSQYLISRGHLRPDAARIWIGRGCVSADRALPAVLQGVDLGGARAGHRRRAPRTLDSSDSASCSTICASDSRSTPARSSSAPTTPTATASSTATTSSSSAVCSPPAGLAASSAGPGRSRTSITALAHLADDRAVHGLPARDRPQLQRAARTSTRTTSPSRGRAPSAASTRCSATSPATRPRS